MNEWQPIETATKDGEGVLLYCKRKDGSGFIITGYWFQEEGEWWSTTHESIYPPTHWMPLPNPPEVKS